MEGEESDFLYYTLHCMVIFFCSYSWSFFVFQYIVQYKKANHIRKSMITVIFNYTHVSYLPHAL